MPRPTTNLPRWADLATNPSGSVPNITEPPDAQKDTGWLPGKPRRDYDNWLKFSAYEWLQWLQTAPPVFESEYDALDPDTGLDEGEVGIIANPDPTLVAPWNTAWYRTASYFGFSGTPTLVCASDTHAYLYRSAETELVAVDLRDGSVGWTKSGAALFGNTFCTDGKYLYGATSLLIARYDAYTGALDSAWNSSGPGFGTALNKMVTDGRRLYGHLTSGNIVAMTIGTNDASTAWTNTDLAGVTFYDLACDGVYVGVCVDYGGPPATFHALRADTGVAITVTSGSGTVNMHAVCNSARGFLMVGEQDLFQGPAVGWSGSTRRILTRAWATHGDNTGISIDADDGVMACITSNGAADYEWSIAPLPTHLTAGSFSSGGSAPLLHAAILGAGSALNKTILTPQLALCLGVGGADWTAASTVLTALQRPVGPRLVRRAARNDLRRTRYDRLLERITF